MTHRTTAPTIDFNRLLSLLNGALFLGLVFAYASVGPSEYADGTTVVLGGLLALQTQLALSIERRRRDPFVIVFAWIMITYYLLRFSSLLLVPFSFELQRYAYGPADTNYALVFVLLSNLFLYAGLFAVRTPAPVRVSEGWTARAPIRAIALTLIAIVFNYGAMKAWLDGAPRALRFLLIFVRQDIVLLMALVYFVVFRKRLSRQFAVALGVVLVLDIVLHTLAGSRGAVVVVLQNLMYVTLGFAGVIEVRRRTAAVGALLSPLLIGVMIVTFTVASYLRVMVGTVSNDDFSLTKAIETSQTAGDRLTRDYALESGIPLIMSRVGYFDYSAEVIAHKDHYARIINFAAYGKSIVDNILSPGFDVFDQPKIANAMRFAYEDLGEPSKSRADDEYQSDQIGIYGEMYMLFGWGALAIFLVGGVCFKLLYRAFRDPDPFRLTVKRVVTLSLFAFVINSYGLDWILLDLVTWMVMFQLYRFFFATEYRAEPSSSPSARRPVAPAPSPLPLPSA